MRTSYSKEYVTVRARTRAGWPCWPAQNSASPALPASLPSRSDGWKPPSPPTTLSGRDEDSRVRIRVPCAPPQYPETPPETAWGELKRIAEGVGLADNDPEPSGVMILAVVEA